MPSTLNCSVLLIGLLFLHVRAGSMLWQQRQNRQFVTGQHQCSFVSEPATFHIVQVTIALPSTISPVQDVYYSTDSIKANIFSSTYPVDSSRRNLEYNITDKNFSSTQLTTELSGYFYSSQIQILGFRYLMALSNSSWINRYMRFQTIAFAYNMDFNSTQNVTEVVTAYPTLTTSPGNIQVLYFLRDIKLEYPISLESTYGRDLAMQMSNTLLTNSTSSQISVSEHFLDPESRFTIRYLVIVLDVDAMDNDLPQLQSVQIIQTGTSSTTFNIGIDTGNASSTLMCGLTSFALRNNGNPNFRFNSSTTVNTLTYNFLTNNPTYSFSVWATAYFDCLSPLYVLNLTNQLCYDACPAGQYLNYTTFVCESCLYSCLTCDSPTQCLSCDSSHFRSISLEQQCLPLQGYFQSKSSQAIPCATSCLTCQGEASNCTSCPNNTFLPLCLSCNDLIEGCELCNQSSCFTCNSSYRRYNSTFCMVICDHPRCSECLNSNSSYCTLCTDQLLYRLQDGFCGDVCADSIKGDYEECDDGNTISHDGCSPTCSTEQDYSCTTMTHFLGHNYTAYCSYRVPVRADFLSLEKLGDRNALRVVVRVEQWEESFWQEHQNLSNSIVVNISHSNLQAAFISEWIFKGSRRLQGNQFMVHDKRLLLTWRTGTFESGQFVQITLDYFHSLQAQHLSLGLNFSRSNDLRVNSIPPSPIDLQVLPDNNHCAHNYLNQTYQQQTFMRTVLASISYAYLGLFLVSWIAGHKRIVAEGIMVVQTAMATVVAFECLSPIQSALASLSLAANPYNLLASSSYRPFDDPLLPNRLRGTGFYSFFLFNLNSGLILLLLPLFLGVIFVLLGCCSCWDHRQSKLAAWGSSLLGQYVLASVIVLGCLATCASVLELQFGIKDMEGGTLSLVACVAVLFLMVAYWAGWLKWFKHFGEFQQQLLEGRGSVVWMCLYWMAGPISGACHYLLYQYNFSSALVVGFVLLLWTYLQCRPVFSRTRDRLRVQCNLLVMAMVQTPGLVARLHPDYSYSSSTNVQLMLPFLVPLMLLLNFLVNFSIFCYLLVKQVAVKEKKDVPILKRQEEQYISERNEQMHKILDSSMNIPLHQIMPKKYCSRFIEEDQEEINQEDAHFKEELDSYLRREQQKTQRVNREQQRMSRVQPTPQDYLIQVEYDRIGQLPTSHPL